MEGGGDTSKTPMDGQQHAGGAPPGYQPQQAAYPPLPQQGYPPPQQGYPPPQQGYAPGQPGYPPQQQAPTVVTVQQQPPATQVIMTGGCPTCHQGMMTDSYTVCGIILAFCFFPLGIICCLMMKERKCTNCGATFG